MKTADRVRLMAVLGLTVWIASPVPSAAAFGTIDSGGQHREHERITRASLSCAGDAPLGDVCFAAKSMDYLAGHDREFGAVGAPDSDEIALPRAHCDNADFLEPRYPRTREQATDGLVDCVGQLSARFEEAVVAAGALLDDQGQIIADEVNFDTECKGLELTEDRAKCGTLEAFGRVLHGAQDFYAHSNWADEADPTRPVGVENPPGLNLRGPSPLLDLRSGTPPVVPADLITGCFVLRDEVSGVGDCTGRVTHAALNKDNGLVDPNTGVTTGPTTPRGMVQDNFAKAVAGAVAESRRQWQDFQSELTTRYGEERAALMACSLTRDDPLNDCNETSGNRVLAGVAVAVAVAVVALVAALIIRRRRSLRAAV
jgi:hypothetical protein